MIKPLLIALSAILVLPNLVDKDIQPQQTYNGKEKFSPQLSFINSTDKLEKFADNAAADKNIPIGSLAYIEILENIVAHRFYNGISHKTLSADWITAVIDRVAGTEYSSLVHADEIIKHPSASGSQQALVMMEILKRKNIPYREIGLSHQFALEVFIKNAWYFVDTGMEPGITGQQRLHQNWYVHADTLQKNYTPGGQAHLSSAFGIGPVTEVNKSNQEQSSRLNMLQAGTGVLSKILWLCPLVLAIATRKRSFKMYAIKPVGKYVRMQPLRPVYNS
jgi:hypothetical protein